VIDSAEPIKDAVKMLTLDVQLVAPKFWFVVRAWNRDSRLVDCGWMDDWDQVRAKQVEHGITDNHVGIDSGFSAEEVYDACLKWGALVTMPNAIPLWRGWMPTKGFERREQWTDAKSKSPRPWNLGSAALPHNRFRMPLLEYSSSNLMDMLARLRTGAAPYKWELTNKADDTYFRHLDGEVKRPVFNARPSA